MTASQHSAGRRAPNLSNRAIAAVAILLAVLLNGGFSALLVHYYVGQITAQRQAFHAHNVKVEEKLCSTFRKLAALQPPAGNPARNPSRAYLQGQHDTLEEVLPDLGCNGGNDG